MGSTMKFTEILETNTVYPGEYLLHKPSSSIVMVGAFNREEDVIRAFLNGKLFEDSIENFNKINLDRNEHKTFRDRTCKKCKGRKR